MKKIRLSLYKTEDKINKWGLLVEQETFYDFAVGETPLDACHNLVRDCVNLVGYTFNDFNIFTSKGVLLCNKTLRELSR